MKKYLLLSFLIILTIAGIQSSAVESDSSKEELVKKSIEVWNTGNAELAEQIFTSDFTYNMLDFANPQLNGVQAVLDYSQFLRTAYPDMKYVPNWMIVEGNTVITQMTFEGTNTGPRGDAAPTNKKVVVQSILISEIKDGKISEEWVYTNEAAIYRQLGMTTIP